MSELKKFLSKKLSYLRESSSMSSTGHTVLHFLDDKETRKLTSLYGRVNIGLLTLEIKDFYSLPVGQGQLLGLEIMEILEFEAKQLIPQFYHKGKVLFSSHVGFTSIAIFFEITEDFTSFANATHLFRLQVEEQVNMKLASNRHNVEVLAGYSRIEAWRRENFEEVFFRAYAQARRMSTQPKECDSLPLHDEFQKVLDSQAITMLYQPVINFEKGSVTGWEAFMRGPEGSFFHMPEMLFKYAEETGEALRLDRLCRTVAIQQLGAIEKDQHLFINVHPATLNDPNFTPEGVSMEVARHGLAPGNIVLEFTERLRMQEMNFHHKTLQSFSEAGFHVALDDVGTGHSSLSYISQLRPDYVKVDVSLVGNIDTNPYHRVMVESLAFLTDKIGARCIAVGIETETELSSLVSMNIFGGQGNILSPPDREKHNQDIELPLRTSYNNESIQSLKCSVPIRELAKDTIAIPGNITVGEVKNTLADKPPQTSVVVLDKQQPVGLVMQYSMDRHLSTQFGMSLYYHRDVSRIMDTEPLMVEADMPIEEVARKAMERASTKIYDDIIVTQYERFHGVVSVQRMLDSLAQTQVELAKGANPLSGLPGNVTIEREIENRAKQRTPTALLYVDLDNFKVYNDVFGFERGDRIILLTATVLANAAQQYGNPSDFVGHVGGDDFVVLATPETADPICQQALKAFAEQTPGLYRQEDVERGYILGKGRDGKTAQFPLTSLSIAIIDCDFEHPLNMEKLSSRVAEVKKEAKAVAGNSCVRRPFLQDTVNQGQPHEEMANTCRSQAG